MDGATGFVSGKDAFVGNEKAGSDEFKVICGGRVCNNFLERSEGEGRVELGVFDVGASQAETIFDGITQDEPAENSGRGDGVN